MTDPSTNPEQPSAAQGSPEAPAAEAAVGASPAPSSEPQAQAVTGVQAEPAAAQAQQTPPTASTAASQPATEPASTAGSVPPPPPTPSVPVPPAAAPAPQPRPTYAQGCLSAAWDDIKASPGWLKKMFFLGLLSCVPILNFVVYGYVLNWVREVPFGGRTAMPREVITGRNFEVGFYYFVIGLVFGLVTGIVSVPIAMIPLLGTLVTLALSFAVELFLTLCSVRMALSKQLGEGFNIAAAWRALKVNWTALLVAVIVPSLLAGVAICALVFIVMMLGVAIAVPVAALGASAASSTGALIGTLLASPLMIVVVLLALAAVFVSMVLTAAVLLLTFRAAAHYIGRYAPQWADEAKVAMGYPV